MHPSRDNADPLFLVFDTNAFLAPPNVYHENRTGDSRTALEMLRSFTADDRGTLPPISVRIPWIVRQELIGLSDKYDRSGDWIASIPGRAAMAVFYINEVSKDRSGLISYQSKPEHQEARAVQRIPEDKDELVLLCSLQVSECMISKQSKQNGIEGTQGALVRRNFDLRNSFETAHETSTIYYINKYVVLMEPPWGE